jgi:hypothetical protein
MRNEDEEYGTGDLKLKNLLYLMCRVIPIVLLLGWTVAKGAREIFLSFLVAPTQSH